MKNFIRAILLLFLVSEIQAQVGFVNSRHPVYDFLERMQTEGVIKNFSRLELPKSRKQIGKWLQEIGRNYKYLSEPNKELFKQYSSEFELETKGRLQNAVSLSDNLPQYLFAPKEKYLYYYRKNKNSFFVNFIGSFQSALKLNYENTSKTNAALINFGGKIRGSLFGKLGFELKATNGTFGGDKNFALTFPETKDNYKFKFTDKSNSGSNYFDNTSGFIAYDGKWLELKLGRDRNLIGNGIIKEILSANSPLQDYFSFKLHYKAFSFSFIYSRLLGLKKPLESPTGELLRANLVDKYFIYHRFALNMGKYILGLGETVIYANRAPDLSYLNPFVFFKSIEHANIDRDNTMLFFDYTDYRIKHFKIYSSLLIDDLDFSKLGTGWLGNQFIFNAGIFTTILEKYLPLDFELQYIHIDPYVYSNRIFYNNYTYLNENLGAPLQPNSSTFAIRLYYTPFGNLLISAEYLNSIHGENIYDKNGNLLKNNGGSVLYGYRKIDLPKAVFLAGPKDYLTKFQFNLKYEFINNYFFTFFVKYYNIDKPETKDSYLILGTGVNIRI